MSTRSEVALALKCLSVYALTLMHAGAYADPGYGVYATASAEVQLAPLTFFGDTQRSSFVSSGGVLQATSLYIPPTELSGIVKSGEPHNVEVSGAISLNGHIDGGKLHGAVHAEGTNVVVLGDGINTSYSMEDASLYELWMDSLSVAAPTGVSMVDIRVRAHFEGLGGKVGGYNVDSLGHPLAPAFAAFYWDFRDSYYSSFYGNFSHLIESSSESFHDADSVVLTVAAGHLLTLELQLGLQTGSGNYYGPASAGVAAMNTGALDIEVLTPGATLTSASGFSYAPAVPEPATAALILVGLAAIRAYGSRSNGRHHWAD